MAMNKKEWLAFALGMDAWLDELEGVTVDVDKDKLVTLDEVVDGDYPRYAVALRFNSTVINTKQASRLYITAIIESAIESIKELNGFNAHFEESPQTHYLGLWSSKGKLYIENTVLLKDKDEALELARKEQQESIYDFGLDRIITVEAK